MGSAALTVVFLAFLLLLTLYAFIPSITMLVAQDPTGTTTAFYTATLVLPVLIIIVVAATFALRAVKKTE